MTIHEVDAVREPLATLATDYESAVIHLAWDRNAATKMRTLLFAFVELLPTEIPAPIDDYNPKAGRRLNGGSDHHVCVRHAVASASDALAWYLQCRRGVVVLPDNDGVLHQASCSVGERLVASPLGEEPPWPTLTTADETADTVPFCPQWIASPRAHHLLPLSEFALASLWCAAEQEAATAYIESALHFSLSAYPEYWGSVHLIAPNPVYRSIDYRLHTRGIGDESVAVRPVPRAGRAMEGVELIFHEEEPWGHSTIHRVPLTDRLIRLDFGREVATVREEVVDRARGVLECGSQGHAFLKSIQVDVEVAQTVLIQGATPSESFEVSRLSGDSRKREPDAPSARGRMLTAYYARKERNAALTYDQRWFQDQFEEARDAVRAIIHAARREVLVVDPYCSEREFARFLLAVARVRLPVFLLTSAEHLRTQIEPTSAEDLEGLPQQGNRVEHGEALLDVLEQVRRQGYTEFAIHVMPGDPPDIHDRFLVVDDRIWLLGSSLNKFGSRGTMMVALPNPHEVRAKLYDAWGRMDSLETWIAKRRAGKRTVGA